MTIAWPVMTLAAAGVRLIDCVHKTPEAIPEGYPYVTIPEMKNGRIDFAATRRISHSDFLEWNKKARPKPNDVVLSRRTNPGVIAVDDTGTDFALGQNLVLLRADGRYVHPPFLRWLMRGPEWWGQVEKFINVGAVFSSLRCGDVPKFELSIPPLGEQRLIAATLGALDDKIELNRRMAGRLEEMARALYRSWFMDFDPVRARAAGLAPAHMDPATAALFPDRFGPDGLPEGWSRKRVGELLTLNYGKALRKDARVPGAYPVFGSGGTSSFHESALVRGETIIVGRKGTVGSVYWAPDGCWPIDTTFFVTSDLPMSYLLRMMEDLPLPDMNTDAAVPGLNRSNVYRLTAAYPGSVIIAAYDELANRLQARIDVCKRESGALSKLRNVLLPKLMSGELSIRETELEVEQVA